MTLGKKQPSSDSIKTVPESKVDGAFLKQGGRRQGLIHMKSAQGLHNQKLTPIPQPASPRISSASLTQAIPQSPMWLFCHVFAKIILTAFSSLILKGVLVHYKKFRKTTKKIRKKSILVAILYIFFQSFSCALIRIIYCDYVISFVLFSLSSLKSTIYFAKKKIRIQQESLLLSKWLIFTSFHTILLKDNIYFE